MVRGQGGDRVVSDIRDRNGFAGPFYTGHRRKNRISRYKVGKFGDRFFTLLPGFLLNRIPDGVEHLGIDVGKKGGRRRLFIAAVLPKGRKGSRLLAILPYERKDEKHAYEILRHMPGMERVRAIAVDNDEKLIRLIEELGKTAVLDTRHFLGTVLRPLARARQMVAPLLRRKMDVCTPSGATRDSVKRIIEKPWGRLTADEKIQAAFVQSTSGDVFRTIYRTKNRLFGWCTLTEENRAMAELDAIVASVGPLDPAWPALEGLRQTVERRRGMIAARYTYRISSAFVESAIGRFGRMHRHLSGNGRVERDILRALCRESFDRQVEVVSCAQATAESFRSAPPPHKEETNER